jgi:hypothetical protein
LVGGGVTELNNFNDSAANGGDPADWAPSAGNDAFDASTNSGTSDPVTSTDLTVMAALGYMLACFVEGARILTANREVAVGSLRAGESVSAANGGLGPVKWFGYRSIDCRRDSDPRAARPVRIRAGAFGPGQPGRDLCLSPDHAVAVGSVLVQVRLLVNGATIVCDCFRRRVRYFDVELDRHDILLAEGLPAESFLDTGNRSVFENAGDPVLLHRRFKEPDPARARKAGSCLPLVSWQAARRRLALSCRMSRRPTNRT